MLMQARNLQFTVFQKVIRVWLFAHTAQAGVYSVLSRIGLYLVHFGSKSPSSTFTEREEDSSTESIIELKISWFVGKQATVNKILQF